MPQDTQRSRGARAFEIALLTGILALAGSGRETPAQEYPSRPIQMIVSFAAGSGTDILARVMAQEMDRKFNHRMLVINRDGGGSTIALGALASAPPDGHTLAFTPVSPIVIQPHRIKNLPFERDAIIPVCQTFEYVFFVGVGPNSPFHDLQSLLDHAKANPGNLRYGHSGIAGGPHLAGAGLWRRAGVVLTDVPYRGESGYAPHLLTGELDVGMPTAFLVTTQKLRPLAVFSSERAKAHPNVPTVTELGYPVASISYGGLYVRSGVPAAVIARLDAACRDVVNGSAYHDATEKQFARSPYLDRAAFTARIQSDYQTMGALLRSLKLNE